MENISYINIDNKSQEEQIKWQNEFEKISYTTFNKGYGIIVLQSPTGSGKTWAIHNLLKSKKVDNNTVVIKKNSVKVKDQWENYGIDSVSLHTDILNHNDLINHINGKKKYDDLKVVVFDEAHENYALLLCGHGCHIRHQGSNYLDKLKERYSKNKTLQSIYNLAREKILILVSDTLDSLICEELPMYSGIFPIDIVVVKPTDNYYNDIPKITYINEEDIYEILENTYKQYGIHKKQIIYTDRVDKSNNIYNRLKNNGIIHDHHIREFNGKRGMINVEIYPITIFVDGGASGLDDPDVLKVYSLRTEKNTVDSNINNTLDLSYDFRQRVGRIRKPHKDAEAFTIREDITRETYIKSIQSSYERIRNNEHIFKLYEKINKGGEGYQNMDMISFQRVPGLITNIIKNKEKYHKADNQQITVMQKFKEYMKNEFFIQFREYIINQNDINTITDTFIKEYNFHIQKLSIIFKEFFNISDSPEQMCYNYTDSYIQQHQIIKESVNNQELKKELYELAGQKCQIRDEYNDIDDLDLARIKEGKDNGEYSIDNVILCEPTIHRLWDRGKIIFYNGHDGIIQFKCTSPKYFDKRDIKLIIKNIKKINHNFKNVKIENLTFRLENSLSGENK